MKSFFKGLFALVMLFLMLFFLVLGFAATARHAYGQERTANANIRQVFVIGFYLKHGPGAIVESTRQPAKDMMDAEWSEIKKEKTCPIMIYTDKSSMAKAWKVVGYPTTIIGYLNSDGKLEEQVRFSGGSDGLPSPSRRIRDKVMELKGDQARSYLEKHYAQYEGRDVLPAGRTLLENPVPTQVKPTIVLFTATWCQYCPQMKANCKAAAQQAGVEVLEVDIDRQDAIQKKWDVGRKVPTTFVVYKKDNALVNEVRINGVASTADLVRYINSAKNK